MAFPKENAVTPVYADELNYMYDPYDIKASMLENAVNVEKLQYCYSLTDVDHDYMVVDVFTDNNGYNDTINLNCCINTITGCQFSCTGTLAGLGSCACVGNYHTCIRLRGSSSQEGDITIISCIDSEDFDMNSDVICFSICNKCVCGGDRNPTCSSAYYCVCNFHDPITCRTNPGLINYCYLNQGSNLWDFYCNNNCICQVDLTTGFPNIIFETQTNACYVGTPTGEINTGTQIYAACNITGTTSNYNCSGLNGYYSNLLSGITECYPTACVVSGSGTGDYYVSDGTAEICCNTFALNINDYSEFGFNILYYICSSGTGFSNCVSFVCTDNWEDNNSCCINIIPGSGCVYYNETRNYKYKKISNDCFCFYCNEVAVCEVTLTDFPNIVMGNCSNFALHSYVCVLNSYYGNLEQKNITTCSIQYNNNNILTTYLKTDHVGAGTITYNVYDATTDCQIGTNLTPNQTHTLDLSTDCAYYKIVQCSDGVSCIKSYALLAGGE